MKALIYTSLLVTTIIVTGCGGDYNPVPEQQPFIPADFEKDYYPVQQPLIINEIPSYLMDALFYLGWDTESPVYHKFDADGNLVISLSPSLFTGRFGPLQRTISLVNRGQRNYPKLIALLHKLESLGDSTAVEK